MEIKTKYNIGDWVWFFNDGTEICGEVANIYIMVIKLSTEKTVINIKYVFDGAYIMKEEQFLFSTKEELLKSL